MKKQKTQKKKELYKGITLTVLILLALVLLQIFSQLPTVDVTNKRTSLSIDSRIDRLEKQMKQVSTETAFGGYGAHTATARPSKEQLQWFVTASLLYYSPCVGGTEFAFTDGSPLLNYPVEGRTKEMKFGWGAGFAVGLGLNLGFDNWDLKANYSHFSHGDSRSISTAGCSGATVIPMRGGVCSNPTTGGSWLATKAKSSYDFDFNAVDLQLGRNYFLSHLLSIRPFFGIKAAFIDLEQTTRYCGGDSDANPTLFCGQSFQFLGPNNLRVRESNNFKGAGPEAGLQGRWFLAKGFSFFADTVGSLIYGYLDVDHAEKISSSADENVQLSGNTHRMVPVAGLTAGIAYDLFFNDDKDHIGFRFGYDTQYYWRANQMLQVQQAGPSRYNRYSEDVGVRGIIFEGRWDF